MQEDLIDEACLALAPVVLGSSMPLFHPGRDRQDFRLLETRISDRVAWSSKTRRREGVETARGWLQATGEDGLIPL